MTDEVFKQNRSKINRGDFEEVSPLQEVQEMQKLVQNELGQNKESPFMQPDLEQPKRQAPFPFQVSGNIPPEIRQMMEQKNLKPMQQDDFEPFEAPPERTKPVPDRLVPNTESMGGQLNDLLDKLSSRYQWEPFELASKGRFYKNIPGTINVRAMTGEEEQILATPRYSKNNKAIDMIFSRCIKEKISSEQLLSVDRTHLLIYLRGISYTPEYDVEIKCPECGKKFPHVIDLNSLEVEKCPDNFDENCLHGVLPASGFKFSYNLATGQDDKEVAAYRDKRIQNWGDQGQDDTLLYRTALLLNEIEGVTMKKELAMLLKKMPIQDVNYLRNQINTPPFGVDTMVPIICPSCLEEFKIDLPLETSFFFPKKRMDQTHQ